MSGRRQKKKSEILKKVFGGFGSFIILFLFLSLETEREQREKGEKVNQ